MSSSHPASARRQPGGSLTVQLLRVTLGYGLGSRCTGGARRVRWYVPGCGHRRTDRLTRQKLLCSNNLAAPELVYASGSWISALALSLCPTP